MTNIIPEKTFFNELGVDLKIIKILNQLNFTNPTPIQHQAIPKAISGKDLIGVAQTGTGKTLAFGIPMIQRLQQMPHAQGLILLPTRELALQVEETLRKLTGPLGMRTVVLIGGTSMYHQVQTLRRSPHIIVATPGRLADHLEQGTANLQNVKIAVLDEADRMFDIGFAPEIKRILKKIPRERQVLLFSATMPAEIVQMASEHMSTPLRIEVAPQGTAAKQVEQEIFMVSKELRMQLLDKLLTDYQGTILVFSRTKHGAKKITKMVRAMGHTAAEIHSDRSLYQRRDALEGFKSGKYRVLIATDIAARGIDVTGIELVINYDLPDNSEDYVHRIGRTGRAGHVGKAISFASADQRSDIRSIERLMRKTLPISALPVLPPRRAMPITPFEPNTNFTPRFHGGFRQGGNRHGHDRGQSRSSDRRPFRGRR